MKKILWLMLSLIALLAMVACTQPVAAAELKSDKPRETSPAVTEEDLNTLVKGNSAFALNLYQLLAQNDGNLFYSPYSISEALAMTWGGARGETETQMAAAMQFLLAQDKLHPAFNGLDIELAKRGENAQGTDGKGFRLNVVNALWGQKNFSFNDDYLDLLAQNYGAGMRIVDYINATEEARQTINTWVAEQTEQKIKDLIPQGSLDTLTRLVLTNAIYFNAAWASQFEEAMTQDGPFYLLNGESVTVPLMHQQDTFKYAEGDGYQGVALPYDGNQLSMVILLPAEGQFETFEASLDSTRLATILDSLKTAEVNLALPKFQFDSEFSLKQALTNLGMANAFSESEADFSGMDGQKDLYITDVIHKAYVSVDENGTEAAAASGVIMGVTSMPLEVQEMQIDRPFIFLIRDNPTGSILFMGRVLNPEE